MTDSDLPTGWSRHRGSDLYGFVRGVTFKKTEARVDPAPDHTAVLRAGNISESGRIDRSDLLWLPDERVKETQRLQRGDIVIATSSGSARVVGKAAFVNESDQRTAFGAFCGLLRPLDPQHAPWLHQYFRSKEYREIATETARGANIHNLKSGDLLGLTIAVPPPTELPRIVARIESLQARSRRAKEALDAIPPLLERFRQSVLAAAFRGDLTADWRRRNPDAEPASVLLERIRAERKRGWVAAEAEKARSNAEAKAQKAGKAWTEADDRKALEAGRKRAEKRYKEPEPVNPGLPELPSGWCWSPVEALCSHVVDCLHRTPKYTAEGFPAIRTADVVPGRLLLEQARRVSHDTYLEQVKRLTPEAGDILYTREGERYGLAAVVPEGVRLCLSQRMMQFRLVPPLVPNWFAWALNSPHLYGQAQRDVGGSTSPHVNIRSIKRFSVPLAPAEEQGTIARILSAALEGPRTVAERHAEAVESLARLDQSVLAKAFRGEF